MSNFANVGAAYERTTRGGEPFILLKLELPDRDEAITVMLFKNRFKLNSLDKRPDLICYLPSNEPEEVQEHPF